MVHTKELDKEAVFKFDELNSKELELDAKKVNKFKKIAAEIRLSKSTTGINADFRVNLAFESTCVRCLDRFTKEFETNFHLTYVEGNDPYLKIENVELNLTDADKVYYRGTHIDLSIGIREAIILSLPIALLCKENCSGLCPICGINLNKDQCRCKVKKIGLFSPASAQMKQARRSKKSSKTV